MKKILILTQKVDKDDPVLGFFHNWVGELSKRFEKVTVICLEMGSYDLPENVKVFSLGKESGRSKVKYVKNFLNLILGLHKEYDAVLVHMNQEYVLLGGFIWKVMGKRIYMWRNHIYGNILTRIAVSLSDKVFCTSEFSYTARFKKTEIMPVGIDTGLFRKPKFVTRNSNSILFLGRMSPIKRPDLLIEALKTLNSQGVPFEASLYGDPLPKDEAYYNFLKTKVDGSGLGGKVKFYAGVANQETAAIYGRHEIFVNLTPSGSFDKTILEAASCGCILVISNKSLDGEIDGRMLMDADLPEEIAQKIGYWLKADQGKKEQASEELREYVLKKHNLNDLMDRLCKAIHQYV